MSKSKKVYSGLFAFALVVIVAATASSSVAYQGDPATQRPNHSDERHLAMTTAFTDNNYEDWKALMSDKGRVLQVVNADNFARFAKAHQLALDGNLEEAKAIRAELGLGLKNGDKSGQGSGQKHNGQRQGLNRNNR